jgi:2-polyprenyl-3-methyl-5-hydroxy-6-metoxy-1,4-benzoquinol methylase
MLNDRYAPGITTPPDVDLVQADFYNYVPKEKFDLVICNQVMEHVPDPARFAAKLLEVGHVVIASVPYLWPSNAFGHLHHNITHDQLVSW